MALICAFCLCGSSVVFCKWVSQKCAPPGCVTRYACMPSWEVLRSRTQPCLCYKPVHINPNTPSRQTRSYLGSARSSTQVYIRLCLPCALIWQRQCLSGCRVPNLLFYFFSVTWDSFWVTRTGNHRQPLRKASVLGLVLLEARNSLNPQCRQFPLTRM